MLVVLAVTGFGAATAVATSRASATTSAPTWYSATAFRPGAIVPLRTINVYSASAFWKAWNAIRPGDKITVHGVAFTGEAVFAKRLSGWAAVQFDATTFTGAAGSNLPAVWVHDTSHVRFYGGQVTNPDGGAGMTIEDSSSVRWWGFTIHDTAGTGLLVHGTTTAVDHLDIKGTISHWGLKPALDPHAETGTGLYGADLGDGNYGVMSSRFALYLHDGAAGSGVAAGGSKSTDGFWNNALYLWCQNLTMRATSEVAGNCAQVWGQNVTGNKFAYLEAENLQGRPYDTNGVDSGQSLATDSVVYGRASNTNLNPYLARIEPSVSASAPWDTRHGTAFGDVTPVTTTTTTPTTTTATTTTATTTTTSTTPSSPTWYTATSYPAPSFTPLRTINVSTASAFWTAWNAIRPGDRINVHGVAFTGETEFAQHLSGWAEVHFDSATTFTGAVGINRPAVWIHDASHIRFYGGRITNPAGGAGITIYDSTYITWWNFVIDRTANTGLFVQGIKSAVSNVDLKGEISHWGLNLALDPHAEKGTGLHGANLADANYGVKNSRFALYIHDGAAGSGVEAGGSKSTDGFWNNTLYLWCQNLTMVATSQVAGNCAQLWGDNVTGNTFAYLEAENLEARPYDANGMYSGQSLTTESVVYGRASHTNLSPYLSTTESSLPSSTAWDGRHGTVFDDVLPAH